MKKLRSFIIKIFDFFNEAEDDSVIGRYIIRKKKKYEKKYNQSFPKNPRTSSGIRSHSYRLK